MRTFSVSLERSSSVKDLLFRLINANGEDIWFDLLRNRSVNHFSHPVGRPVSHKLLLMCRILLQSYICGVSFSLDRKLKTPPEPGISQPAIFEGMTGSQGLIFWVTSNRWPPPQQRLPEDSTDVSDFELFMFDYKMRHPSANADLISYFCHTGAAGWQDRLFLL